MATGDGSSQLPHGGASKYGLDGGTVVIVRDRGEQDYRKDFGTSSLDQTTVPREPVSVEALTGALIPAMEDSFDAAAAFIPRQVLQEIMSPAQVTSIIRELGCFGDLDATACDRLARRICFGDGTASPCYKLLAALTKIKRAGLIKCAMDDGMSDECFPLKLTSKDPTVFFCQVDWHKHTRFGERLTNASDRITLGEYSYSLTAPYLKQLPDKHFHYVLEARDHIIMRPCGETLRDLQTGEFFLSDGASPPGDTDLLQPHSFMLGRVFKVKINVSHYDFDTGEAGSKRPQKWFALKRLGDNRRSAFESELESLLYCLHHQFEHDELLQEGQKHIAHVRASFERYDKAKNKTEYYFLFDWQEGSLWQLWQNEGRLREDEDHPRSMSQQIFGIAAALQCVHNDRVAYRGPSPAKKHFKIYGRHGNLGPSNILYSKNQNGEIKLLLADLEQAQLHRDISQTSTNSDSVPHTKTFGAPEAELEGGEISWATDIFTLGCIVLEHITWYLVGWEALDQFSDRRCTPEPHRPGFSSDTYWTVPSRRPKIQDAILKPEVLSHIRDLKRHPRCSWYLRDMLELIEDHMLIADPRRRIPSSGLTRKLDAFRETCRVDQSYYTGYWQSDGRLKRSYPAVLPIRSHNSDKRRCP